MRLGTERWLKSNPMAPIGPPILEHYETLVVALIVILVGGAVFNLYETPVRRLAQRIEAQRLTKVAPLV